MWEKPEIGNFPQGKGKKGNYVHRKGNYLQKQK